MLEEVQKRNRRTIATLGFVAFINYWFIMTVFAALFSWGCASKVSGEDTDVPVVPFVVLGAILALILTIATTLRRVLQAADATLADLGATVIEPDVHPRLHNLSEELAIAAGISPVRVAILDDPVPNALSVGAGVGRASIVVTSGLLTELRRDELEAVLAVQMCEVRRLDVALQTVVTVCSAGAIGLHETYREGSKDPRNWPWIAMSWPSMVLAERLRRHAFARCDFGADDMAITITRHPDALLRALVKLLDDSGTVRAVTPTNALLWFEPMPPGSHSAEETRARYSVTPPLDARIDRLLTITGTTR